MSTGRPKAPSKTFTNQVGIIKFLVIEFGEAMDLRKKKQRRMVKKLIVARTTLHLLSEERPRSD